MMAKFVDYAKKKRIIRLRRAKWKMQRFSGWQRRFVCKHIVATHGWVGTRKSEACYLLPSDLCMHNVVGLRTGTDTVPFLSTFEFFFRPPILPFVEQLGWTHFVPTLPEHNERNSFQCSLTAIKISNLGEKMHERNGRHSAGFSITVVWSNSNKINQTKKMCPTTFEIT